MKSKRLFWISLFAPSLFALLAFTLGQISHLTMGGFDRSLWENAAGACGFIGLVAGMISPIYCGVLLANRFCNNSGAKVMAALGLILGLGLMNLILLFAGCVGGSMLKL